MTENSKINTPSNDQSSEIDLFRLIGMLIDSRWLIIITTTICLIVGVLYCLFSTPVYRADALVQVEQNAGNSLLNNLSQMLPNSQPASAPEIELLKSRMILSKTVSDLNLRNIVTQDYFPFFGKGFARLTKNNIGKLDVSILDLPESWGEDLSFKLTVTDKDSYIISKDGIEIAKGYTGRLLQKGGVSLLISNMEATPGTSFTVTKTDELNAVNTLLTAFSVTDKGKDTGVLGLSLTGENKTLIKDILNSITANYLAQNISRKSERDANSLDFLDSELPRVRSTLDLSENKLNQYRQQNDSVDLSLEAKSILDSIVAVDKQLNELTFKEAEISKLYTKEHPAYRALLEKRQTLEDEKNKLNKRVGSMPKTQQEILRLSRDVQSGQEIYMQLLNKEQELSISKASTVGNVRVIDRAVSQLDSISPKKSLAVLLSMMIGFILSVGYIFIKFALHNGLERPEQLEEIGINVYASVPFSEWQSKKDSEFALKNKRKKVHAQTDFLLAFENSADLSIEAIRGLRTSLHFAMMEAKNNVLMISGASPGIGKTYISANLAAVISQAGQRVLFIDSDLRKGYAHELFGLSGVDGLSDILSLRTTINSAIKKTRHENLDFLPRGAIPPNPSELLMHARFGELIMEVSKEYDLVLIDTPPILAVTDAAIIGKSAGTSLMVARFEVNTPREVAVSVKRFAQNGIEIKGVILNAVVRRVSSYYGGGYENYNYNYK